jgi:hypothetical protein
MSRARMLNNRRSPSARNLLTRHAPLEGLMDEVWGEESWRKSWLRSAYCGLTGVGHRALDRFDVVL